MQQLLSEMNPPIFSTISVAAWTTYITALQHFCIDMNDATRKLFLLGGIHCDIVTMSDMVYTDDGGISFNDLVAILGERILIKTFDQLIL